MLCAWSNLVRKCIHDRLLRHVTHFLVVKSKNNDMWNVASTTGVISSMFTDTGTILTAVIATLVAAIVALLGLGFAVRHLKKYVTGRKF